MIFNFNIRYVITNVMVGFVCGPFGMGIFFLFITTPKKGTLFHSILVM